MKPDDIVELPDGRRLVVITPEQAAAVCKDVQLWELRGEVWYMDLSVDTFRNIGGWRAENFTANTPAIEIDPPKEEYEPECQ